MNSQTSILIGLLSCVALLAGTHIAQGSIRGGACDEIETISSGVGYRSSDRLFEKRDETYKWFVADGRLVIDDGDGRREEFRQSTIESFVCILPPPKR